jgi:hypothetical protein
MKAWKFMLYIHHCSQHATGALPAAGCHGSSLSVPRLHQMSMKTVPGRETGALAPAAAPAEGSGDPPASKMATHVIANKSS